MINKFPSMAVLIATSLLACSSNYAQTMDETKKFIESNLSVGSFYCYKQRSAMLQDCNIIFEYKGAHDNDFRKVIIPLREVIFEEAWREELLRAECISGGCLRDLSNTYASQSSVLLVFTGATRERLLQALKHAQELCGGVLASPF